MQNIKGDKPINLFKLVEDARTNLADNDNSFHSQSAVVLGILRAVGIVPFKRASQNGALHKLLSATLVTAHRLNETLEIPTRKLSTYHDNGISTRFLLWLDTLVMEKYLVGKSTRQVAEGELQVSEFLSNQINKFS